MEHHTEKKEKPAPDSNKNSANAENNKLFGKKTPNSSKPSRIGFLKGTRKEQKTQQLTVFFIAVVIIIFILINQYGNI